MKNIKLLLLFIIAILMCFGFTSVDALTITGNSVYRESSTTATIRFFSNTAGTAYYKITSTSAVPSDIVSEGTGINVTANSTTSISLTDLSSGSQYVHIVVTSAENVLSNVLTISMPYNIYYFEDFEAYDVNTKIAIDEDSVSASNPQLYICQNAVGTGRDNQEIIMDIDSKVLKTSANSTGLDIRTNLASSITDGYIVYQANVKNSEAHQFLQYGTLTLGCNIPGLDIYTRHVLAGIASRNSKFGFFNVNTWQDGTKSAANDTTYNEKIVLNVATKKYDYYVDNEKINIEPVNAKNYGSAISWFGVYNGGGVSYYDDIKMYITDSYFHNIIKNTETNGTFEIDKSSASDGETVRILNILPDTHYKLKEIKILRSSDNSDVTSSVNYSPTAKTFTMPNYEVTVNVEFELISHTITFNAVNGVTFDKTSPITATSGSNKEITLTTNTGYRLTSVKVNNIEQLPLANNKVILTNITENKEIVVLTEKIPFTITANSVTGATISPNGTLDVLYGDSKDITITANTGYRLTSVKVNNIEQLPLTENKITLTNITENLVLVVNVEKIEYGVTDGNGQKHTIGKSENAVFKINADKDLFLKVYLNDEELNSEYYTITEGSTIITIKKDFLNTLLPGTYNLKATFSDGGEANTTFVIAQLAESNPQTGDSIMLSIILGIVSLIGLLGIGLYTKKKI